MKSAQAYWLSILLVWSGACVADESGLRRHLKAVDGWVGYRVAMVERAGSPCCYSSSVGNDRRKAQCDLDSRSGTFVSESASPAANSQLSVYWRIAGGKPVRVRAFAADCPVTSRQEIRWIDPVDSADSVAVLESWISAAHEGRDSFDLAALALHADAEATAALIDLAAASQPAELRQDAIFWLGQARGAEGANFVERVATADPDAELREHAVFSLSQSDEKDAYERVRAIAQRDASGEVRGKALFWMAQMSDSRAGADITAALSIEASEEVREEAIFALSQLEERIATKALIEVIRGKYPRQIREKALFWLGQSDSEEAFAFLDGVLTK